MSTPNNLGCPRCGMGIHWDERVKVVGDKRWHADCAPREPAPQEPEE